MEEIVHQPTAGTRTYDPGLTVRAVLANLRREGIRRDPDPEQRQQLTGLAVQMLTILDIQPTSPRTEGT